MNKRLSFHNNRYRTAERKTGFFARLFPSLVFYYRFFVVVSRSASLAKKGRYDWNVWCDSSRDVLEIVESVGADIEVEGVENLQELDTPCVFIGNHMSFLETVILPSIMLPFLKITYVVKESLLEYPIFKHVMRSRNPIAVTRTNPRKDLKTVMTEGVDRLQEGISIIVFPQTTRSTEFDPKQLSTIGVKLAKKAGVPVVPLALKTDALTNGKLLKDFGKIDPTKKLYFSFGQPLDVNSRGGEEHQKVLDFIGSKMQQWHVHKA